MTLNINKNRNSNIELLRILTMLLIVLYHLCRHGFSAYLYDYTHSLNNFFIKSINQIGEMSNCIFLMISGYFLVEVRFSWRKVFKLWFHCFFVSALIGSILYFNRIPSVVHGGNLLEGFDNVALPLTKTEWKMYLHPILYKGNWFTTIYLPFYVLSPFLSTMVKNITRDQHKTLLLSLLFFGFVLNMFDYNPYNFSRLYYFCSIFFVASYIRIYQPEILSKSGRCFLFAFIILIFYYFYVFSVHFFGSKFGLDIYKRLYLIDKIYGMEHLPLLACSVFIFCGFNNLKIPYNKIINTISSCTLTIYLLHDNTFHRDFFWQKLFKVLSFWESKWFIPYAFFCVFVVFVGGVFLEIIRKMCVEKYVLIVFDYFASCFNKSKLIKDSK